MASSIEKLFGYLNSQPKFYGYEDSYLPGGVGNWADINGGIGNMRNDYIGRRFYENKGGIFNPNGEPDRKTRGYSKTPVSLSNVFNSFFSENNEPYKDIPTYWGRERQDLQEKYNMPKQKGGGTLKDLLKGLGYYSIKIEDMP